MNLHEYLKNNILLFDGAMGTYFSAHSKDPHYPCEYANITSPNTIRQIHRRYIEAGAKAIRTNTFSLHIGEQGGYEYLDLVRSGYNLAKQEVEGTGTYLFCSLGPPPIIGRDGIEIYKNVLNEFISLGGKYFLFETFSSCDVVNQLTKYLKEINSDVFVMASYAVDANGISVTGELMQDLIQNSTPLLDAVGLNCICGPHHMEAHIKTLSSLNLEKSISVMPNSSYPTVLGQRVSYQQNPQYFAKQMENVISAGASIIGGCCGTTPEFIAHLSKYINSDIKQKFEHISRSEFNLNPTINKSLFYEKLSSGQKPITVELDPPASTDIAHFLAGAKKLKQSGADLITIADCPIARARMDSSILACKLKRELDIEVMPHMTCRDRNFNATKALLLGLAMEKVTDILLVTGDPIPTAQRNEVKAVYESNSRMLMGNISALNKTEFASPFYLYGALNINAKNFDTQLKIAKGKIEKGAMAFFTQPVLSEDGLKNLKRAKKELNVPLVGGILPIVSYRNAVFLNNEIPGITVDQEIINKYEGKIKEECAKLAVQISADIAKQITPYIDGYYLITPFQRTEIITEIISCILSSNST